MGKEQETARFREMYKGALEKGPVSTAQLLRWAKNILIFNPEFSERSAAAAYLNVPWISFSYNDQRYLARFDKKEISLPEEASYWMNVSNMRMYLHSRTKTVESLSITKYLPENKAEEMQIVGEGFDSEQKFDEEKFKFVEEEYGGPIFRGVSYAMGTDKVGEELKDEATNETSWSASFSDPLVGKKALPEVLRMLKELL